jgi:biotin operon repressor
MLLSEQLKEKLRNEFMPIPSLKIYSNADTLNLKISFLKSLSKGIRGTCSMILDFMECRVNTQEEKENYMIVYASQQQMADELGLSREWISNCISRMVENENCIFTKVRQGLNKANYYIMQKKKEMVEILKQIFKAQQEEAKAKNGEKQDNQKKEYKKYARKESKFNDFEQRDYIKEYGSFDELEKKLLGLG